MHLGVIVNVPFAAAAHKGGARLFGASESVGEMRTDLSTVLIGPARPEWLAGLHAALRFGWRVERSETRAGFQRDLAATTARDVVLCELDGSDMPNAPLLAYCARRRLIERVILVHESPTVRLPSSWTAAGLAIDHVMRGRRSISATSLEVAALLRVERWSARGRSDADKRTNAFPVV